MKPGNGEPSISCYTGPFLWSFSDPCGQVTSQLVNCFITLWMGMVNRHTRQFEVSCTFCKSKYTLPHALHCINEQPQFSPWLACRCASW